MHPGIILLKLLSLAPIIVHERILRAWGVNLIAMKLRVTTVPGTNTVRLVGELDIYSVEAARAALLQHLGDQPGLTLELANVATCDAAGLQWLLAARRSAEAARKPLVISTQSPAIGQCAVLLGVELEPLQRPVN